MVHSSQGNCTCNSIFCCRIMRSTLPMRAKGLLTTCLIFASIWTVAQGLPLNAWLARRGLECALRNPAVLPILGVGLGVSLSSLQNMLLLQAPPERGFGLLCMRKAGLQNAVGRNSYIYKGMRGRRQGLQFSFGLKQQQVQSARSTPKFPSIEISKPALPASERKQNSLHFDTEPVEVRRTPFDLFKDMGGGVELLKGKKGKGRVQPEKMLNMGFSDTLSVQSKDSKSVKSTKSLGERFLRRTRPAEAGKGAGKKQSNSLANILELKMELPIPHRNEDRRILFKKLQHSANKPANEGSQDTLKLESSFFEGSQQNLEFRETKKMLLTLQRIRIGEGAQGKAEGDRSKVFRHFLHKPRATLRFTPRAMNNDKIESIARKFQGALP